MRYVLVLFHPATVNIIHLVVFYKRSILDLPKIPAPSELFRPAKTDFSAVNVPTGTFPSDKISFNSSETSSARDEVLRKSSIDYRLGVFW